MDLTMNRRGLLGAVAAVGAASALPAQSRTEPFATALAAHLDGLAKRDQLSGVVLVARKGIPIFRKAFGFRDLSNRVPNQVDTKFNIASMGKMFTAVAILQLREAGALSLDDTVGRHLPDYGNAEVRDTVTIRQLLTHTSGLGNFLQAYDKVNPAHYRRVADYLPLFVADKLLFKPGTSFAYSNTGFMVLGLIIESASGMDYFDYIAARIYRPAGMANSGAFELDAVTANSATGYTRSSETAGEWRNNLYVNVVKGGPAGGSFSTADDMLAFANALAADKLLGSAAVAELTTGKVPYGTRKYAFGFTEEFANGHRIIGHGGGNIGIANELMMFTDLGQTAVVLTNGDVDNFWDIQSFIKAGLAGPTPDSESYSFTKRAIETAARSGYDAGLAILKDNPTKLVVRSGLIEYSGRRLLWDGRNAAAVAVFRLNVFFHPEDSQVFASLGDALRRNGDVAQALVAYRKYLEMEPDDTEVQGVVKSLNSVTPAQ